MFRRRPGIFLRRHGMFRRAPGKVERTAGRFAANRGTSWEPGGIKRLSAHHGRGDESATATSRGTFGDCSSAVDVRERATGIPNMPNRRSRGQSSGR
jgi:hypothetical protein